jgi:hypothetical protein
MKPKSKSNLAKLALAVLNGVGNVQLVMKDFNNGGDAPDSSLDIHDCRTSCCMLGHAPLIFEEVKDFHHWYQVAGKLFPELENNDSYWTFLFSGEWSNNRIQCTYRALLVIEDRLPKVWEVGYPIDMDITTEELKQKLQQYII